MTASYVVSVSIMFHRGRNSSSLRKMYKFTNYYFCMLYIHAISRNFFCSLSGRACVREDCGKRESSPNFRGRPWWLAVCRRREQLVSTTSSTTLAPAWPKIGRNPLYTTRTTSDFFAASKTTISRSWSSKTCVESDLVPCGVENQTGTCHCQMLAWPTKELIVVVPLVKAAF